MEIDQGIRSNAPWESVLAQIITWHHEIPIGEGHCEETAAVDICVAALEAARRDNLFGTIRAGGYEVRRRGEAFRVRQRWNPAVEAADMFLEVANSPAVLPEVTPVERAWIKGRPSNSRELPPSDFLHAACQRALTAIEAYCQALPEGRLPGSFQLDPGLTVGHATTVLSVVMGFAALCEATARIYKRTETTLVNIRRARLLDTIAELHPHIEPAHIETVVERLTYKPGRSCRTSPLVEIRETSILCPPLITPRVVDGIILRGAAYDPNRYGPIGQRQGNRAAKWKEWLSQIPGVLVAERIRARRIDRRVAGDLDVVAVDKEHRRGICFEIKWPIDATTLPEVIKIEDWVKSAAIQADRLRAELTSGAATVEMPKGWPAFEVARQFAGRDHRVTITPVGLRTFSRWAVPARGKRETEAAFIISAPGPSPGNPTVSWPLSAARSPHRSDWSTCTEEEPAKGVRDSVQLVAGHALGCTSSACAAFFIAVVSLIQPSRKRSGPRSSCVITYAVAVCAGHGAQGSFGPLRRAHRAPRAADPSASRLHICGAWPGVPRRAVRRDRTSDLVGGVLGVRCVDLL